MDEKRKYHQNHKSHPYNNGQRNIHGASSNAQQYNSRKDRIKYVLENESSGKIFIHPSSMHDEVFPKFQQPFEIGIILSESKKKTN
jgi:hypothetical protein